ncbi:MAG: hypothetical protein M3305_02755 [Actinomycetota bacterium]|nr:hypothetical protein [Actinomycetota bacterium]
MSSSTVRWCGLAAMLGGALSVVAAVVFASMPRGCIGAECAYRPMRDAGIAGAMLMLALLLVMVGAVGVVIRTRHAGRLGWLGIAGVVVGVVAATLLAIGTALNTRDSSFVPMFIIRACSP